MPGEGRLLLLPFPHQCQALRHAAFVELGLQVRANAVHRQLASLCGRSPQNPRPSGAAIPAQALPRQLHHARGQVREGPPGDQPELGGRGVGGQCRVLLRNAEIKRHPDPPLLRWQRRVAPCPGAVPRHTGLRQGRQAEE